jgi:hypothetical protein
VKVTDCPTVDGLKDEVRLVVVEIRAGLITSLKIDEVLLTLLASPLYLAVMEYVPALLNEVFRVARAQRL